MQYTIETRELTNGSMQRPAVEVELQQITIEANDAEDAISRFVQDNRWELLSISRSRGGESIAMVKNGGSVFLARVYIG